MTTILKFKFSKKNKRFWLLLQMLAHYLSGEDDLTTLCVFSGVLSFVSITELNSETEVLSSSESALHIVFDKVIDIRQR